MKNYLFENIVLPNSSENKIYALDNNKENFYYKSLQNNFDSAFNSLSEQFKDDPLYNTFIDYYSNLVDKKRKKINIIDPKIIEFYENNVENFSKFKNLLIMKAEADECMKKIKLNDETLKKMKYIKKKYQLIKKEMKKFLYPNQELYLEYYEE